jgi:protein SCO1
MAGRVMNEIARFAITLLPVAAFFSLTGCDRGQPASSAEPPLAGASIGGAFSLVDQDGKTVKDSDFAGRYRLIYFGYTFCPDVCPVDVQRLMQGYRLLEKSDPAAAAKLQPIFISIDPDRDNPAALKQFVGNFHPKLIGLTGTPEQIAAVAKSYAVYYRKAGEPGAKNYLMDHAAIAYLMGPDGKPIALVPEEGDPPAIETVLRQWVK